MKNSFQKIDKPDGGFTIIEMMVAISVFLVVVMAGMGSLLNANALHNKSQNMRSIMDNLSFIMDDMSRNLRTGYDYRCYNSDSSGVAIDSFEDPQDPVMSTSRSCPNGWALIFESANGDSSTTADQWAYYFNNGKIYKSVDGIDSAVQLTPDEVSINMNASGFSVLGAEPPPGDTAQPFVIIRLAGTITYQNITTPFSIETSVSQRLIDTQQ